MEVCVQSKPAVLMVERCPRHTPKLRRICSVIQCTTALRICSATCCFHLVLLVQAESHSQKEAQIEFEISPDTSVAACKRRKSVHFVGRGQVVHHRNGVAHASLTQKVQTDAIKGEREVRQDSLSLVEGSLVLEESSRECMGVKQAAKDPGDLVSYALRRVSNRD